MKLKPISPSGHPGEPRSDYRFDRIDHVLIVIDNDRGRSVTTDAAQVVDDLARSGNLQPTDRLIYRDTQGEWDELIHRDNRFVGFAPVRVQTLGEALQRLGAS